MHRRAVLHVPGLVAQGGDLAGGEVEQTVAVSGGSATPDPTRTTEWRYDAAEREQATVDAEGGVTTRSFDTAGNVVALVLIFDDAAVLISSVALQSSTRTARPPSPPMTDATWR